MKEWGSYIKPYDFFVSNKIVNGKQLTVVWHVENLKISHVNSGAVE